MTTDVKEAETLSFEADVSRLLYMMVHSVYSDRSVFLRELISNAADACEKLRYELSPGRSCSAVMPSLPSPFPRIPTKNV